MKQVDTDDIRESLCMRGTFSTMILKRQQGFTAIELLVVLALMAIFVAFALPSFEGAIKQYRVSTATSEIANALQFARAEAIRTRQTVAVAQTSTPLGCSPADSTANLADWRCGVDVYADAQGTGGVSQTIEPIKTISATDFKGLNVQLVLTTDSASGSAQVIYDPIGFFQGGNSGDAIYIWPVSGSDTAATSAYTNTICLGAGGQVKIISSYVTSTTTESTCL
jgi:type IV fimbrial biogenesis protein FimT